VLTLQTFQVPLVELIRQGDIFLVKPLLLPDLDSTNEQDSNTPRIKRIEHPYRRMPCDWMRSSRMWENFDPSMLEEYG